MRAQLFVISLIGVLVVALVSVAGAVPGLFSYQGRLTAPDGEPVPDGNYALTFALFDVPTAGDALWTETHPSVPIAEGVFSLILGTIVPFDASSLASDEHYLEVTFEGDAVLPRTRLTSSAYAQRVATIDGASGGVVTAPVILVDEADLLPAGASGGQKARANAYIEFAIEDGLPSMSLWEPVDSKGYATADAVKKIELRREGIIMFGATEADTNLLVAPNGDIIGIGQITMGENSSSGVETSVLGFGNVADGDSSSIAGGSANVTTGTSTVISGGYANTANGQGSTIGGGSANTTDGQYSTISGGSDNVAAGDYAMIPGGQANAADGAYSAANGRRAKALHNGSFVWADQTDADFSSTGDDQFIIRAGGGVGIGTNSPLGQLDVAGPSGDESVNLPGDAISAPETFDEPGIAAERAATSTALIQGATTMQTLVTTSIAVPADGFIVVRGLATLESSGTSGSNHAFMQVDDAPGGTLIEPFFAVAGSGDHDSPNRLHFFQLSVERVFPVTAGTHTFYLEALADPSNDGDANSNILRPFIIATYYPTAYGTVSSSASTGTLR